MKVLSLLPSVTEIVYALGSQENLVGVSCDCNYPEDVSTKPVVSAKVLPITSTTTPAEIDRLVRDQLQVSESILLNQPAVRIDAVETSERVFGICRA